MWRYLILLLAVSPLLTIAALQVPVLVRSDEPATGPATGTAATDFSVHRQELEAAREAQAQHGVPGAEVHAAVVNAADECAPGPAAGSRSDRELAPVVKAHANALRDAERFLQAWAGLDRDEPGWRNPFPSSHAYGAVLEERRSLRMTEQRIRALRDSYPEGVRELQTLLVEYGKRPGADRRLLRDTAAYVARKELVRTTGLETLPQALEKALFPGPGDSAKENQMRVKEAVAQLRKYLESYADVAEDRVWANGELARWEKAQRLLDRVERDDRVKTAAEARVHLDAYARLVEAPVTAELPPLVRRAVIRFCESYLPANLPLDDEVLLSTQQKRVKRRDVRISWKGKAATQSLIESRLDEFTIKEKEDEVDRYYVGESSYEKPLTATPRSVAAHRYNTQRKQLRWTVAGLKKLLQECEPYREELSGPRERAEVILGAFMTHSEFSGGDRK